MGEEIASRADAKVIISTVRGIGKLLETPVREIYIVFFILHALSSEARSRISTKKITVIGPRVVEISINVRNPSRCSKERLSNSRNPAEVLVTSKSSSVLVVADRPSKFFTLIIRILCPNTMLYAYHSY